MSNDDPYVGLEPEDYAPVPDDPSVPSVAEVMQNELENLPAVPVRTISPINVRRVGNKEWVSGNVTLDAAVSTNAVRILNNNPNRARSVVWSSLAGPTLGRTQGEATSSGAALPVNTPVYMEHAQEVWVRNPAGSAIVSWLEEVWTE